MSELPKGMRIVTTTVGGIALVVLAGTALMSGTNDATIITVRNAGGAPLRDVQTLHDRSVTSTGPIAERGERTVRIAPAPDRVRIRGTFGDGTQVTSAGIDQPRGERVIYRVQERRVTMRSDSRVISASGLAYAVVWAALFIGMPLMTLLAFVVGLTRPGRPADWGVEAYQR